MLLETLALKGAPIALKALAPHLSALWHTYGLHGTAKLAYDASIATGIYKQVVEDSQAFLKAVKSNNLSEVLFHSKNLLNFITDLPSVHSLTKELSDYLTTPREQKDQLKQLPHLGQDILDASSSVSSAFKEISSVHKDELVEESLKQPNLNKRDNASEIEKLPHNENLSSVPKTKLSQRKDLTINELETAKYSLYKESVVGTKTDFPPDLITPDEVSPMQSGINVEQEGELLPEDNLKFDSNELLSEKNCDSLNIELQTDHSLRLKLENDLSFKDASNLFPEDNLQLDDGKLLLEDEATLLNPDLQVDYSLDVEDTAKLPEATAKVPDTVGFAFKP